MKKVAIFENQYHQVKIQFEVANRIFFNDELVFDHYNSSQEFQPFNKIVDYDLVIVDISLSSNSDLDGFDFIEELVKLPNYPKILILTGISSIKEGLRKRSLPDIPVLMKPIDPVDIKKKIEVLID